MNFDTRQLSVSLSTLIGNGESWCPLETRPIGCPLETRPLGAAGVYPQGTKPFTEPSRSALGAVCPTETKPFVNDEFEAVALT